MNKSQQKPPSSRPLMILFIVIVLFVITIGFIFFKYQRISQIEEKQKELSGIADLKIRQITQWRFERLGGGEFLKTNVLMVKKFKEFIEKPANKSLRNEISITLESLVRSFDYKSALLISPEGTIMMSYPEKDSLMGDHLRSLLPDVKRSRKVMLTDLHRANLVSYVHLDLIVPLIDQSISDTLVTGILALRVDPEKILFPLIQSWPVQSKTSETLLIRKEGDEIVYLNRLRHDQNSELFLRKPIKNKKLAAVMAIQGITATLDAEDYRGVHVIASMKKIPGTQWYMVAKMDQDEVLKSFYSEMVLVFIIVGLIIGSAGLFLSFVRRNQRVKYYREKYETELDRLALVKHFDYILKFANDIILLINSDLKIVEANDMALTTYGYSRSEFIGISLEEIRAPETVALISEQIKMVRENESATFETIHKRRDGSIFPVEISSRIVMIEGLDYYQTIGRNITERKNTEETLRESEERFRKIFEESPLCIAMTDKDMTLIRANQSFCKMIGYEEDELISMSFRNFTHPDHIEQDYISLMRLVAKEIPIYKTEKKYITRDGLIIWGSTTVSIVRNNKGEVQFFLAMVEDITVRKKTESELEGSFSLVKATLESTEDGILVVDMNGKIVQFNQRFIKMWRIPEEILNSGEDSVALNFVKDQLVNPESFIENVNHLYADYEATTSCVLEFVDGRCFERYSQPQKIGGKCVGRVWSFRDITEKKKAERDLIAAKDKAEESDRLKTAFLHNVSHEIRTPMNAILGFLTLLNEPDMSEDERLQFSDIIFQSSNQLLSIINDIVDIANVEAGQVKMNFSDINLNSVLRGLNEQFIHSCNESKIPINLITGLPDEESNIRTDSTKLIQILSNLLNNSLKFTTGGHIEFGYLKNNEFLEFTVKDTGIGIPAEHIDKIFNRFYQVDVASSRQFGGTGLGLSICKAYVELLGGDIRVQSEPEKGTLFTFTIPYIPVIA